MPERRHPADREAGGRAHLVGARRLAVDLGDAAVAGAEHHRRLALDLEDERLHDLADLAAAGLGRLGGGPRRVGQDLHLDLEPPGGEPFLHLQGGRMHHCRKPRRAARWEAAVTTMPRWSSSAPSTS